MQREKNFEQKATKLTKATCREYAACGGFSFTNSAKRNPYPFVVFVSFCSKFFLLRPPQRLPYSKKESCRGPEKMTL